MADPMSQCAKYNILQTECILVHEMRQKCFPDVSCGAIKSQIRRLNMLAILAPVELGEKLKQKFGKKRGGYYLTPVEHAHRLIETRATLISQNKIPQTATRDDPSIVPITHSTGAKPMQIPVDEPAESNLLLPCDSLPLNFDDSVSNLPDLETTPVEHAHHLPETSATLISHQQTSTRNDSHSRGTPMHNPVENPAQSNLHYDTMPMNLDDNQEIIQPSSSKDMPSCPQSSSTTNKTIHEYCNASEDSQQSDSSESSIQASQPHQLRSLSTPAKDHVSAYFLWQIAGK